jgi:predicted DNA binding protein
MKTINVLGSSYKVQQKDSALYITNTRQSNFGEVYENGEFRKMFQKRGFTDKERAAIKAALNL